MKKTSAAVLCLAFVAGASLRAGGLLESFDITAGVPSPIPGHILARVIGIKWDARSLPVQYRVNVLSGVDVNGVRMVPNPLGAPALSVAEATVALQASFDAWNNMPTSFIDMRIVGTRDNPGLRGFDFVNELDASDTAAGFTAIASSPSVNADCGCDVRRR